MDRAGIYPVRRKFMHQETHSHHIRYRVHGSHLMEMDLIHGLAVNLSLCPCNDLIDRAGILFNLFRDLQGTNQCLNIGQAGMHMMMVFMVMVRFCMKMLMFMVLSMVRPFSMLLPVVMTMPGMMPMSMAHLLGFIPMVMTVPVMMPMSMTHLFGIITMVMIVLVIMFMMVIMHVIVDIL